LDSEPAGFQWVDCNDADASVLSLLRKKPATGETILAAFNFTPVPRFGYRMGVPQGGYWQEILNSDASEYGGSGLGNLGGCHASDIQAHGLPHSLELTLPPLAAVFFKKAR